MEQPAADAGAEILRAGGNAADAAIATAFAQCVVDPVYAGIAGTFHGVFWDATEKRAIAISGGSRAPLKARADAWELQGQYGAVWTVKDDRNRMGYEASTVPAFIRGASTALSRCGSGRMSWRDVMAPAIRLASEGFTVYPYLYRLWSPPGPYSHPFLEDVNPLEILGLTEAGRQIYLHEDGSVYAIGERLLQSDYAKTLQRIADNGPDEFYEGETGALIAADFQAHGGWLDTDDLKGASVAVTEPIWTTFGEYDVVTEQSPSVGPVIAETLNIVDGWPMRDMGWNSAEYLDRLQRAMHVAFRDRLTLLGDPDFVDVPIAKMVSKEYASELRGRIEQGTDLDDAVDSEAKHPVRSETTHLSVIDNAGNGAAITHSIGCASGVVTPGLGFLHNSHMEMFNPVAGSRNGIVPGKRALTGGGPVLFVADGELRLVIGSPGGARKVSSSVQAAMNMILFGMPIDEAVAVDRIHAENEPRLVIVEPNFPPDPLLGLAERGQRIRFEWYTGRLAAVARAPDGALTGGSDPRAGRGLAVVP